MFNSPLCITTKTSIQPLDFALLPAVSQYCLRQSIPSLAQGGPRSASSSSEILMFVESDALLERLRSSSSCASRIIVCDKFDAKPRAGVRKAATEVAPCHTSQYPSINRQTTHFVCRGRKARRRTDPAIEAAVTAVRTVWCTENCLYASNTSALQIGEPVRWSTITSVPSNKCVSCTWAQ